MTYTPVWDFGAKAIPAIFPSFIGKNQALVRWTPGVTPWSTPIPVAATLLGYLALIHSGRALQKRKILPVFSLKWPFVLHNIALSLSSGLLFAAYLEEIVPFWYKNGLYGAMCFAESWSPRMETLYIINYMFKYIELIDTCFMMLKGKPMPFLHVYHHFATALLCFSQLVGKSSVSWVVITLNLFVHLIMYAYYAMATLRIPCPFKRYITTMQIVQFVIDLAAIYTASANHFNGYFNLGIPGLSDCASSPQAASSGLVILTSYLFLFIRFYQKTYKSKSKAERASSGSSGEKQPLLAKAVTSAQVAATRTALPHSQRAELGLPSTPQLERGE
ncbi:GNS1/SUR4 membrane protein [Ceraceosorus guamensis]|uniref:Elongation of fatty acids protein n=1 Tax=Ceraceosorus guamensis TaxID=1522189 RepID=A0A316W572_9BASI|nr:GNS1/SUR4 membrane protein [Ceraceosorus guamensis]PWN45086.1 GNS1/SUR4 membrane protein [Ceraceosorus guamensis]